MCGSDSHKSFQVYRVAFPSRSDNGLFGLDCRYHFIVFCNSSIVKLGNANAVRTVCVARCAFCTTFMGTTVCIKWVLATRVKLYSKVERWCSKSMGSTAYILYILYDFSYVLK